MGLFGIGDDNRMVIDVPVRYAPILGLPYDANDPSVFERSSKKINIVVSKGKGKAKERKDAVDQLMEYGIPYQAALSLVGEDYEILDNKNDPGWNDWRLEDTSPDDVAKKRFEEEGRFKDDLRGIDVAQGAEYGQQRALDPFQQAELQKQLDLNKQYPGRRTLPIPADAKATDQRFQIVTGEQGFDAPGDPFGVNVLGDESKSVKDAIAAMEQEQQRQQQAFLQEQAEKQAAEELVRRQEAEQVSADEAQRQVQEQRNRVRQEQEQQQVRDAELRARAEEIRNDPKFAAEEGLGGERSVDPVTGEVRDSDAGGQVTDRGVIGTPAQTLQQALQTQQESDRLALEGLGEFSPFDIPQDDTGGSTSIQEMLNIFNQDPERYYTNETIIGPDGQAITQQVLSPVAEAALQAFSTQRGAEAMETGSRFGAGSPFGVIAGTGGTAQQAIDLAEQQAYSGINSPFAALQTGGELSDISQILRGGLSAQQQSDLAGLQARGGLGVEDQFALSGMQARGGLTPQQMQALAGLQARGGLTPQQRYQEQRLAMMPSLLQMSPQSLGGFSEVFGQENLQNYLSPFFNQPEFAAQGAAPAVDWTAQQALPQPINPSQDPRYQQVSSPGYVSNARYNPPAEPSIQRPQTGRLGMPIMGLPSTPSPQRNNPDIGQNILSRQQPPVTRQTLGGYGKDTPFARGGTQAKAAIAGKELEDYLGEVTPFGGTASRGGLGSSVSNRFTY